MNRAVYLSLLVGATCYAPAVAAQQASNPFESVGEPSEGRTSPRGGDASQQRSDGGTGPIIAPDNVYQISSDGRNVTIGSVSVNAGDGIAPGILADSYEPFIGLEASQKNLQALASAVSKAARESGYVFASAQVPQQSIKMGIISVRLDPGPIDEIRIVGSHNKRLKKILNQLLCGAAVSHILERQLLLASDLPGIFVESTNYERENGRGVLVVTVREDKVSGYAVIDNYGPETLGPVRARIEYDMAGLLSDDDVLTSRVISTALQPSELIYFNSRYARTLGDGGTVVGISGSAGRTHSGGYLNEGDFKGRNLYASVFASLALKRSRDVSLWLNGEIEYLKVEQSENGVLFQDDRIVTATVNFAGNYNLGFGRIYGGIGVTQGLGILGASKTGGPLNSRLNGSGEFTRVNMWLNSILDAGGGFGVRLAANAQIASRPLLSPNEIAIGGPYFGKGYDFSERFGDEGILGLTELRKEFTDVNQWLDWFQLYGFVDGGYVNHIGTGNGDGSLASAGGGMRAQMGKLDLGFEVAAPITDDRFESGEQSAKVNVQVGLRF